MTRTLRQVALALTLGTAAATASADATTTFDTISKFQMLRPAPPNPGQFITGVPRNSSTPVTVQFGSDTQYIDQCIPLILTMMEKPGRYYLTISVDDGVLAGALRECTLELRN
jgi:hypothetical protein